MLGVLEGMLFGISAYKAYEACKRGWRCGVEVVVFALSLFVYVAGRMQVDRSVVALAVAVALLVMLALISG